MTDDFISRQAAINTVFSMCCRWDTDDQNDLKNMLLTAFQDLPAAQERKKGKWIEPASADVYKCSVCEEFTTLEVPRLFYHFCPNCGAEMKGEGDER